MQALPHLYSVVAAARVEDDVTLESHRRPRLHSAPPSEFGGPGDRWSPETLLVAAVADCFVLTFRAIARMSKLSWISLACDVTGTVDRIEHITQFTGFVVRARLQVSSETNLDDAHRLLARAEQSCWVTNSLKARSRLESVVDVAAPAVVTAELG